MADQDQGALTGAALAQGLAYGGDSGQIPPELTGALKSLFDPERSGDTENKAYWAGMMGPTKSGSRGEEMSNALTAQVNARNKQDELKASYIPLIMQSLAQQRANSIAYGKFALDRQKEVNPLVNSALYGLQANGQQPTMDQARQAINSIGMKYGMDPRELYPHHYALHAGAGPNGENLGNYLQSLRVAAAPAEAGLPSFSSNAAGQTMPTNRVTGAVGTSGTGATGLGANPTKTAVDVDAGSRGDVKTYTNELADRVNAYKDILQRVNAIDAQMQEFTPGKYAGTATSAAAIVQDLQKRFPNVDLKSLQEFANKLAGPGADPTAAAQFAESLKTQEALAQLKTSLEGQGRIGQQEFRAINNSMLGNLTSPQAFSLFKKYVHGLASNSVDKYSAWGQHMDRTPPERLSVHGFDIPYETQMAKKLLGGQYGDLTGPGQADPSEGQPARPGATPVRAPAQPSGQVAGPVTGKWTDPDKALELISRLPQNHPELPNVRESFQQQYGFTPEGYKAAKNINLNDYEPGAKIGPKGLVYVGSGANARPAKKIRGRSASGQIGE